MKAYLDYNVFISIEKGEFSLDSMVEKIDKRILEFPFSRAHIQEVDNIVGESEQQRQAHMAKRLETIRRISNCLYLYQGRANNICWLTEGPSTVLGTVRRVPAYAKPAIEAFAGLMPNDHKEQICNRWGIAGDEFNGLGPREAVQRINSLLREHEGADNILQFVERAESLHPDDGRFGQVHYIAAVVLFLDMVGYWKAPAIADPDHARPLDPEHIQAGSFCDYLVSDDKLFRHKARAVYEILEMETRVVSSNGRE